MTALQMFGLFFVGIWAVLGVFLLCVSLYESIKGPKEKRKIYFCIRGRYLK